MLTITNERGEQVEFPPGGITIKELLTSFGNARINVVTEATEADKQTATEETADSLNGYIHFPSVQAYPLIVKSGGSKTVKNISVKLAHGSASARLLVGGIASSGFSVDATIRTIDVNLKLSDGQMLELDLTAQSGSAGLGFTIGLEK